MIRLTVAFAALSILFASLIGAPTSTILSDDKSKLPVAYVTRNSDLHVIDAATGDTLYEVVEPGKSCPVTLSSDGRWLLYTIGSSPPLLEYMLVDLNSGVSIEMPHTDIKFLNWRPDGFIYFHSTEGEESGTVYQFEGSTGQSQVLFRAPFPMYQGMWREFGNNIVYVTSQDYQVTLHRDSEPALSFSLPERLITSISISPSTRYMAFTARDSITDDFDYYVLDFKTGEYESINKSILLEYWRPDSNTLAYIDSEQNLIVYDVETQDVQRFVIIEPYEGFPYGPKWSPMGRYVAYAVGVEGGTDPPSLNLRVLDTLTGDFTLITYFLSEWAGNMRWVSETQLVYDSASADYIQTDLGWIPGNADLLLYDVPSGEKTRLTDTPEMDENLVCLWG